MCELEVKNDLIYISATPVRLYGVYRVSFIFNILEITTKTNVGCIIGRARKIVKIYNKLPHVCLSVYLSVRLSALMEQLGY
jgi:hypothetical protein